jgi:Ca2+-binding EF-hand superfamily protein
MRIVFITATALLAAASLTASSDERDEGRGKTRFAGMDRNGDGVITRSEWRGNDRSFRNHDWNGDGVLSGAEVAPGGEVEREDLDRSLFGHLDRNNDGRLSRAEWGGTDASWREMDANRDGFVTRQEFYAAPAAPPVPPDAFGQLDHDRNGVLTTREWHGDRDVFNRLDRNRDGVVSRAEFSAPPALQESDRFPALDRNNDGVISRSEWPRDRAGFDALDLDGNGVLTRDEFRLERFRQADRNGDGVITRGEWDGDDESFNRRDANRDGRISKDEFLRY